MSIALITLALQSAAPADAAEIIYVTGDRQGERVTSLAVVFQHETRHEYLASYTRAHVC